MAERPLALPDLTQRRDGAVRALDQPITARGAFGEWTRDASAVERFRPHRLGDYMVRLEGVTPDLGVLAGYTDVVADQALFVLDRYLCGGVALRSGGSLTWPQVLQAHSSGRNTTARQPRNQSLPAAALLLVDQHRRFVDAVEALQQHPMQRSYLLRAHAKLCPEISGHWRGRLRWGNVWVRGKSVADAKFVPVGAEEIATAVDQLIADCNQRLADFAAPSGQAASAAGDDGCGTTSALAALRARADLGFAAHLALLGWHPFADGNGRVARALYQSLASGQGENPTGALFAAAHLLVLRALQAERWGQNFWRAQRGLSDPAVFLAQCQESAGIAVGLCKMLLNGLHAADPEAHAEPVLRWWHQCPLVRMSSPKSAATGSDRTFVPVALPSGRTGGVARSTIAFLMAFELALHDCVEASPPSA